VRHPLKTAAFGNPGFKVSDKTVLNFNHLRAGGANQVVMVTIIAFCQKLKTGDVVPEIEPFHHSHSREHMDASIHGREVAIA
jgi:hypothetical protein